MVVAEIVAGGLTSSGLRARTLQSGHVSGRHFGGAGPANAAVYVRSRDAGRARLLLEDRDEGHRVVRDGMDSIGRDFRLIVTLSAALVLAVLAVALVVTVLGPA